MSYRIAQRGGRPQSTQQTPRPQIYLAGSSPTAPDSMATELENVLVKSTAGKTFDLDGDSLMVPGRRSFGTKGRPTLLRTNYFPLSAKDGPMPTFYRYDVDIEPRQSAPRQRRVIKQLLMEPRFNAPLTWATNYSRLILTTTPLDLGGDAWAGSTEIPSVNDELNPTSEANNTDRSPPDSITTAGRRERVNYRVVATKPVSLGYLLHQLEQNRITEFAETEETLSMINTILCKRANAHPDIARVGQNGFFPFIPHPGTDAARISPYLQALRGYFASARPAIGRILVNVNVTCGAFFTPQPVAMMVAALGGSRATQEACLRHLKVTVNYPETGRMAAMQRVRTIRGFAKPKQSGCDDVNQRVTVKRFGNAHEVHFLHGPEPKGPLREVSVYEYYKKQRGIILVQAGLPVLNCGTEDKPSYIPMELCTIRAGQPYKHLLSPAATTEMLRFAARTPYANAVSIAGQPGETGVAQKLFGMSLVNATGQDMMAFNLKVGLDMLTVPGRILAAPKLSYRDNKIVVPHNGSWNFAGKRFVRPGKLGMWQIVVINVAGGPFAIESHYRGQPFNAAMMFNGFEAALKATGIEFGPRQRNNMITLQPFTEANASINSRRLDEIFQEAKKIGVQLLFFVLPTIDTWLYSQIKKLGDIKYGIHTVSAVGKKMQNPNGQGMFFGNLALKVNVKGGGVNHVVPGIVPMPLKPGQTMFMGIDVTHPTGFNQSKSAPSIAAVVANTGDDCGQWPGSIRLQQARVEMVGQLASMVDERLALWKMKNKQYPTHIICYRDGVSEGQYPAVLKQELPGFEHSFSKHYGPRVHWPKLAIIIVAKRHHTRFYPTRVEDADWDTSRNRGSWNPLPGTVVDRGICGQVLHEFWLQAHQGLQGTAKPAHYVVIKDDIGLDADQLESMTHNLCYAFARATKAISVCPPAYLADLLCERGRKYLHDQLSESVGRASAQPAWDGEVHPNVKNVTWYL